MKLEDFILQQIHYLASPTSDLPKSIAAFGVTPKRFESLFTKSDALFKKIKAVLEKNRRRELNKLQEEYSTLSYSMQEERNEVANKYQNLINNYRDRPELLAEICEWETEALSPYETYIKNQRNRIKHIQTPLRERVENFELVDFNFNELRKARKRIAEIYDEYGIDDQYSYNAAPFEIREEFNSLSHYNRRLLTASYAFVHELDELDDGNLSFEFALRGFTSNSGLISINWGAIFFEPNHKYWANQASEELKEIIYTKFTIFDDAVNITPIENRLKDELDSRNIKYEFQYPYKGYILDFFIEANGRCINVECDGKDYHSSPTAVEHDRIRNNVMAANSIYVLRFSGSEIWKNVKSCVDLIEEALK
jgi:very-short-patch-repair endonuclease